MELPHLISLALAEQMLENAGHVAGALVSCKYACRHRSDPPGLLETEPVRRWLARHAGASH